MSQIGYDSQSLVDLQEIEDWYWWFRWRNRFIQKLVRQFGSREQASYLEIGAGNGAVTRAVHRQFPELEITATEYFEVGLETIRKRLPNIKAKALDATKMDQSETYDIIGAFDVVEHISDDQAVLNAMAKSLNKDGVIILSVPQHMWLWSDVDVYAKHERRYTRSEMRAKLEAAGLEMCYSNSYVSFLLPAMLISRFLSPNKQNRARDEARNSQANEEFNISKSLNTLFSGVMWVEEKLRNLRVWFPIGGSLFIVARHKVVQSER